MQVASILTGHTPGRFGAIARRVLAQLEHEVNRSTNMVAGVSRLEVPVLSGDLRESCRVWPMHTYTVKQAKITYSGPYAVKIHENLDISHPIHAGGRDCGGSAKYLEGPQRRLRLTIITGLRNACRAS